MTNIDLSKLHTNQRLFVEELFKRDIKVEVVDYSIELLKVSHGSESEYLLDRTSKVTSYLPSSLAADKHLTKYVLEQNNIPIPNGHLFDAAQVSDALAYGDELGFPVVLKPNVGSHGELIWSGIENKEQLEIAIYAFLHQSGGREHFIIEEHIQGLEHRIFITTNGDYAVLQREPSHVIGDGKSTIKQLADVETKRRQEIKEKQDSALCPIALDQTSANFLRRKGMSFNSVPKKDEKVYLRLSSNLAQGGISRDMTDEVHPSVIQVAKNTLVAFDGLPCLGIDFITPDITQDQSEITYGIIEVNANPGLAMHHLPAIGEPRNVARYLVDVMFPEKA